jgi:hypothetical protein
MCVAMIDTLQNEINRKSGDEISLDIGAFILKGSGEKARQNHVIKCLFHILE